MWKFGHSSYEIVEIPLPFIHYFCVNERDRFFRNGGDKAPGKSFDECCSHFVKLIKSAIDIDGAIFIATYDVIYDIAHESISGLVAIDIDLYVLSQF